MLAGPLELECGRREIPADGLSPSGFLLVGSVSMVIVLIALHVVSRISVPKDVVGSLAEGRTCMRNLLAKIVHSIVLTVWAVGASAIGTTLPQG